MNQNEQYIGKDVINKAIEKVKKQTTKEGGKGDEKKRTTRSKNATV